MAVNNIPVFVISLQRCPERREYTQRKLNGLGIPFQFIEAVDGDLLSGRNFKAETARAYFKSESRFLLKGEIGCALSHLGIYRRMLDENIETACVLEDDNDYCPEFKDMLKLDDLGPSDWDILRLGHWTCRLPFIPREAWTVGRRKLPIKDFTIGRPIELALGSYAYLIRKSAAEVLLRYGYPVRMPADFLLANAAALKVRTRLLCPPCVLINGTHLPSTIYNGEVFQYTSRSKALVKQVKRKIKRQFPAIQILGRWLAFTARLPILVARKTGIRQDSYAKKW